MELEQIENVSDRISSKVILLGRYSCDTVYICILVLTLDG
jgi:hypothetical protein